MTDNEITKGLEICSNNGDCKECPINPHHGNYGYCTSLAIKAALDLINRQKAEIEKLQEVIFKKEDLMQTLHTEHQACYDELVASKAEIERLKGECANCPVLKAKSKTIDCLNEQIKDWQKGYCELKQELKVAKAEATKEFAERVKDIVDEPALIRGRVIDVIIARIDDLVKEKTEAK